MPSALRLKLATSNSPDHHATISAITSYTIGTKFVCFMRSQKDKKAQKFVLL